MFTIFYMAERETDHYRISQEANWANDKPDCTFTPSFMTTRLIFTLKMKQL